MDTSLSAEDYIVYEKVSDLLAQSADMRQNLAPALSFLLEALNRPRGVLFVTDLESEGGGFWVSHNLPIHWENQLEYSTSPIKQIAAQVVASGQIAHRNGLPDLAAAFPLQANGQTLGALLVWGPEIPVEQFQRWQACLRPFGRTLALLQHRPRSNGHLPAESVLKALAEIQTIHEDLNEVQLHGARLIRDLFLAEDAVLVLLDEENPRLAIEKQVGPGLSPDWKSQSSAAAEESLAWPLDSSGQWSGPSPCESLRYHSRLDTLLDNELRQAFCVPLTANQQTLGAFILLNPGHDLTDPPWNDLLKTAAASLASAIYHTRTVLRLKISNADLEARTWEIMNSRNTLRTLFDSIPSSVYIIDRSYTIIAINKARSRRANTIPQQVVGRKCYQQIYNRMDPCPGCRVRETFVNASLTQRIHREWLDQEKYIDWEITTYPIQEKTNLPHQVILFEQDITEKRLLESNLIQSEKLAAVGQLAAGVAHEINNPLAAIIANAQILRRELRSADEDTKETVTLIETAGVRAAQVVSNLLGIARKEKKYEFEPLSLNETLRGAVALVHHEVVNRAVEVHLDLQEDMPEIVASKNHIQGVWINLIVNGMDAISAEHGQITITSRYEDKKFIVSVADNGRGIPEEYLTRIFEPFFTTKMVGRGTGLGLSVCQRVVKEHGGLLQVESRPGQGTRFTVTLPEIPHTA